MRMRNNLQAISYFSERSIVAVVLIVLAWSLPASPLRGQEADDGGANATPILEIDVSFFSLDTTHELVGKLDAENLATDLLEKRRVLASSGAAPIIRRFAVTTLDEEQVMIQLARVVSVVTGRQVAPNGRFNMTQERNVGTLVRLTPAIRNDAAVINMTFEASYMTAGDPEAEDSYPQTKTVTVQMTAVAGFDKPTIIYDAAEEGDGTGRNICIIEVSKVGDLQGVAGVVKPSRNRTSGFPGSGGFDRSGAGRTGGFGRNADSGFAPANRGSRLGRVGAENVTDDNAGDNDNERRMTAYVDAYFQRYDKNGDGKLQVDGEITSPRTKDYDKNEDGAVSRDEFLQGIRPRG